MAEVIQMKKPRKVDDRENEVQWKAMLKEFDDIVKSKPAVAKVKEKLEELSVRAGRNKALSDTQQTAIEDRCRNYIKGTYKSTKNT